MSSRMPKCKEADKDCFAIEKGGNCRLLKQGYVYGGCPFYQPARCVDLKKERWDCLEYARTKGESTEVTEKMWSEMYGKVD